MKRPGTRRTTPSSTPPSSTPRATAPGRGGCRRRHAAKPGVPSATPGACSRRGARFRRAGGSGRCRPGVLGAGAAGRGTQHRSAHPADAVPSAEAALLGRVYPHRTGSPTPRPSTPDTPRPPATGSPGQNPAAAPQGFLPLCRAGVRRRRATARSTLTNPPTCPTATTNPVPSTLTASNVRCAVVWGVTRLVGR